MRSSSVAVQRQQPKNSSAVSGRMPSRTKADGHSAIDNSKVASSSVTDRNARGRQQRCRTDGLAVAAVVVSAVASVMQGCSRAVSGLTAVNQIRPNNSPTGGRPPRPGGPQIRGRKMDFDQFYAKTPATIDEIRWRVTRALDRHPLCRNVEFDIVSMPRTGKSNWTISLRSVAPGCALGGLRYRGRHPGSLRSGRSGLIFAHSARFPCFPGA